MRAFVYLAALAACSGGSSGPNGNEPCPGQLQLSCTQDQAGETCDEQLETGPATCRCADREWTCTDCPGGELPIGACGAPGAACEVWGFENACGCTCNANGTWECAVDDPDPNFHCSVFR